jgi:hypothetical protein
VKRIIQAVVLAALAYGGFKGYEAIRREMALRAARARVTFCLEAGARGDNQASLAQWAEGKVAVDADAAWTYSKGYDAFCRRVGLRTGATWDVGDVELHDDGTATVTVQVDGGRHELLVDPEAPIEVAGD